MPSKTGRSYGQKDADNTLIYAYSQKLIPEFAGLLIDGDGNILFCSENAKELCSYRSNGSLINLVFAEDRDVLKRCLEARSDCCIRLHFRKKRALPFHTPGTVYLRHTFLLRLRE